MSLIPGFKPPQPGNINLSNPFNQKIPGASPPPFPTGTMSMNSGIPSANIPQPPKPVDESYRDLAAPDQFKMFQSNPDIAQHEYGRITDAMNLYKASGDTNGYNAANDWMNKFNTATGGAYKPVDPAVAQFQQYQQQQTDMMKQLQSFSKPMNYDPTTDPQAIAYKQFYDNLAKQNSQNAMEDMNSRGLLNSSMTAGEVAKAQQDAGLQYGTKVADLGQQFYNRQQDQFNNQAKLVGLLGDQQQRSLDNQHWNQNYQLQQNADQRAGQAQQFNQGVSEAGLTGNYNGNRTIAGKNADLNEMQTMAQLTGYMPDGQGGVKPTSAQQQVQLSNMWKVADTSGTIPDQLADMYGLPHGTQTIQAKQIAAELAYKNASLGIEGARIGIEAQNAANQANYQRGMLNNESNRINMEYGPDSLNSQNKQSLIDGRAETKMKNIIDNIDSSPYISKTSAYDETGNQIHNMKVTDTKALGDYIFNLGLPEADTKKLYARYNLKWGD